MAKKKQDDPTDSTPGGIPVDAGATMQASREADPGAPVPDPRAHMWERPIPAHEQPPSVDPHADYAHPLPRWVHKGGDQRFVTTPEQCEAALADGWEIHPSTPFGGA